MLVRRRHGAFAAGLILVASACASSDGDPGAAIPVPGQVASQRDGLESAGAVDADDTNGVAQDGSDAEPVTTPSGDDADPTTTTEPDDSDREAEGDDPGSTSTTTNPTTSTTNPTTTTTVPELDVYDPKCVVQVQPGDSLGLIADEFDDQTVTPESIISENDIANGDVIYPDQLLDVCVDNGLDDRTGAERAPNAALADAARQAAVIRQQEKLNQLFAGSGMPDLLVDGVSGPVTRQRLCAARVAMNIDVNRNDMEEGSDEEAALFALEQLRQPFTSALNSERWILIDRTCQIMFTGEGDNGITNIFSTSTGEAGHETRDQDRSRAYRFDPALDNGGWHNSTTYPVPEDNPLNGNMYKPLYFDGGQAIHGSNNVPTTPQSKGCARLRVADMEQLIGWLGLGDVGGPTYNAGRINVTVNVQGAYEVPADQLFTGDDIENDVEDPAAGDGDDSSSADGEPVATPEGDAPADDA